MVIKAKVRLVLMAATCVASLTLMGQNAGAGQQWLGTWFAPSVSRAVRSTPPAAPGTAATSAQSEILPPAVRAVAPNQQLRVGSQSSLHFKNQTLRQIAHISLGGARLRVVFSNAF